MVVGLRPMIVESKMRWRSENNNWGLLLLLNVTLCSRVPGICSYCQVLLVFSGYYKYSANRSFSPMFDINQ